MDDLYAVLGVDKSANVDEIKRAYRKEALAKHPDRGGDKAEFQTLQSAYDILSDPAKRAEYDHTGSVSQNSGGFDPSNMPDLSAMFGSIFSGGVPFFGSGFGSSSAFGGGPGSNKIKAARGPNKIHEIGVGLADLYRGKTFKLNMKREVLCGGCQGSGGSLIESCGPCGGKGFRVRGQQMGPIMAMTQEP